MILFAKDRFLFLCLWGVLVCISGSASANLLLNPGFEDVAGLPVSPGNNITDNQSSPFAIPNWQKTGTFNINLVRVDGPGGLINYGNQGPESDADYSGSGVEKHYLDQVASGNTRIYQTFSLPFCASGTPDPVAVDFGAEFSNRLDTTSSVFIEVSMVAGTNPSSSPLAIVTGPNLPPGASRTYPWTLRSATANLTRGQTYTYSIRMSDSANVDNTFVIINPADSCPSVAHDQGNVAEFLQARNTMILDHEPDRHRRVDKIRGEQRKKSVALPYVTSITPNEASFQASAGELDAEGTLGAWDIWAEGAAAKFNDDAGRSGLFGISYFGVDYQLSPAALFGVMLQIDHLDMDFDTAGDAITGTGWMVGPYATVQLGEKLFFDIRGSWGESRNNVVSGGVNAGKFSTTRWLVSGALIGDLHFGNWTIRPELQAKYISENQEAFDSGGTIVAAQTISQGDVRFSPRIAYEHITDDGATVTTYLRADGIYSFLDNGATEISRGSLADAVNEELRARIEAGLDFHSLNGLKVSLSGYYDGIGQSEYEVIGGMFLLAFHLH